MKHKKKKVKAKYKLKFKYQFPFINLIEVKPINDTIVDIVYFDFEYKEKTKVEQACTDFVKNTVNSIDSPDLNPLTEEELKND